MAFALSLCNAHSVYCSGECDNVTKK